MSLLLPQERRKGAWCTFMVADGCLAALVIYTQRNSEILLCR